ncbi:hypothetical protein LTR70_004794 [Exophiala xenobiotica]|uniref:Uncharacterized protein n=1 Tax=Lithohypha guttulata TaxID=1690604 RepID=A0ABR0KCE6_9EURO|nr:hypothetical protein LTR24_004286 [Lithohypha guttulata]KAK5319884.1 hypothetical protein LTR70_004794 [Exophiala xenobiotica]
MNCEALATIKSFENYVASLRNVTSDDISATAMKPCRQGICSALYGTGNADVSGIGVIVGYFVEFSLAIILALSLMVLKQKRKEHLVRCCQRVTAAYADSAIALALSVELAAAIMLIRKNFGVGAYEFGGLTVQTVWIVAILVMLPIVPFCWQDLKDDRTELRLCMISLAFILFLINFICRMISTYSEGQIGSGPGKVITRSEMGQIRLLCYQGKHDLSPAGSSVVEIFSIGGSLWVACSIVLALLDQCVTTSGRSPAGRRWQSLTGRLKKERSGAAIPVIALAVWSIPLFWALVTLRSWQKEFAASLNQQSGSDVWSFGQIIAVVVFLPVLNELLYQYLGKPQPASAAARQHAAATLCMPSPKPVTAQPGSP